MSKRSLFTRVLARFILPLVVVLGFANVAVAQQKDKIRIAAQVWYPSFPMYVAMTQVFYS